jgi:hypothetical protein
MNHESFEIEDMKEEKKRKGKGRHRQGPLSHSRYLSWKCKPQKHSRTLTYVIHKTAKARIFNSIPSTPSILEAQLITRVSTENLNASRYAANHLDLSHKYKQESYRLHLAVTRRLHRASDQFPCIWRDEGYCSDCEDAPYETPISVVRIDFGEEKKGTWGKGGMYQVTINAKSKVCFLGTTTASQEDK